MYDIVKMLLGIDSTDHSKDSILDHYINQALKIALLYCNVSDLAGYDDTIADFAVYLYKNKDSLGYAHAIKTADEMAADTLDDILTPKGSLKKLG